LLLLLPCIPPMDDDMVFINIWPHDTKQQVYDKIMQKYTTGTFLRCCTPLAQTLFVKYSEKIRALMPKCQLIYNDMYGYEKGLRLTVKMKQTHSQVIAFDTGISVESTWSDIKARIVARLHGEYKKNPECPICYETNNPITSCSRCVGEYCTGCYINIIRKNDGLNICPFCRGTTGYRQDVDQLIETIQWFHYQKHGRRIAISN